MVTAWPGRPPTVLQVLPSLVTGGVERGTLDVAGALAEAGATALVVSAGGPMVAELERLGASHVTLPVDAKRPWTMLRNAGRLAALMRERGVDLVDVRSRAPAWSVRLAARRAGVPWITTVHAPYRSHGRLKTAYNAIMAKGDRVIAISAFIRAYAIENYGADPARIRVVPRGIDVARFDPERVGAERVAALARQWGVPAGAPLLLLPSRLSRQKGHGALIDAMALLDRGDLHAVMLGSNPKGAAYRAELERQIAARGLSGRVHIVDRCGDMPAAYLLADVVVSASSIPEGFGRTIVEAQAMKRLVIAADQGAPRELVQHGRTGWLVPADDPPALAAAIAEALALPPERRREIGETAAALVRRDFTTRRMTDATLAVYAELLAEKERR